MNDDRRKSDDKIELIYDMVSSIKERQGSIEILMIEASKRIDEVHQRQVEVTLPAIAEMKNTLYSKNGLCEVSHASSSRITAISERIDKIPTIVGWIFTGLTVGSGAIIWLFEHFRTK
jgi:hypothetical protein